MARRRDEAMRRASRWPPGLGTTSPNPVVGCVLLDADGEVVGEGFHAYAGGPHAEIVALAQAGERARGGTAVVTLEPCNHTGRTGPCSAGADRRRGRPGGRSPWPTPTRSRPAAPATLRAAGVAGRDRGTRGRGRGRQHRLADRGAPGPAVRDLEVRRHPGRAVGRRRRHQQVDHLRGGPDGRARAARHGRRDHRRRRHGARRRPPADRPRPARRQPGHPPAAAGRGGLATGVPRPRPGSATAPHRPGSPPPPRSAPARTAGSTCALLERAVRARRARRAAGGRPDAGRRVPARPAWSTRSSATSRRSCSAPARPRWSARA